MKREVLLLPDAERDLQRLEDFLIEKSPQVALRAARLIVEAIASLEELSERGRPSVLPGMRELVVPFGSAAYVVEYRVSDASVVVSRVFHSRENR